jgi:hypothetical protein
MGKAQEGESVLGWALAQSSLHSACVEPGLRLAESSARIRISPSRPSGTLPRRESVQGVD